MGRTKQSSSSSWYSRMSRSASAPTTPRAAAAVEVAPPLGCMSMVHYLIFAPGAGCVGRPPSSSHAAAVVSPHNNYHHHRDSQRRDDAEEEDGKCSKGGGGFEAPRNSLDLDADHLADIQIGVQVEPAFDALARATVGRRSKATAPSSEAETPRTPSLVARLMGIDGLPDDAQSPSPALTNKKKKAPSSAAAANKENYCSSPAAGGKDLNPEKKKRVIPESVTNRHRAPLRSLSCNVPAAGGREARSLPDTPRASTSAGRASWDGPRLSLQALKENFLERAAQYMSMPSSPTSASSAGGGKKKKSGRRTRREDGDATPERQRTAKEIVRQAKENVASRKSKTKSAERQRKSTDDKENVSPAPAPARADSKLMLAVDEPRKPVLGALLQTKKAQCSEKPMQQLQLSPRVPLAPRNPPPPPPPQRAKPSRPPPPPPPLDTPARPRKPDGCERFATRIKKPAVATTGCHPQAPSAPATPSAPTSSSASALAQQRHALSSPSRPAVPLEEDPEYGYVRTVLERGGFMRSPPAAASSRTTRPFRGHSVASPVDPIVFHLLELDLPSNSDEEARLGPLRHRWNRKLLFHLTQELLADLLLLSAGDAAPSGAALLGTVWRKAKSFPAADCRVVGDIDAVVARDLDAASVRRLGAHPAVREEAADVANDVADRVLDALLAEIVVAC